jgi:toxin ParE1/3/4
VSRPVLSRAALKDIDAILDHLSREAGDRVAAKYRLALLRLFGLLGDRPELGAPRPELGRDVRMSVVAPYLVLYRHAAGATTILRVLHGRRRITGAMLGRPE